MKKILISIAAVSAVAAVAVPAAASAQGYNINQRQDQLERRIDRGIRTGDLNRREAMRLKSELRETARLEYRYRANGLTRWERADLDRRFDRISAMIRYERHDYDRRDRDYGAGYGERPYRY